MELSSKEIEVLDLLECGAVYQKYFFDQAKDMKWFYRLKDRKYFDPNNIKCDQDNNFYFWPPLDYLEKIAIQINENPKGKEGYAKELLKIIGEVVAFSQVRRAQGETPVNNYHIWWFLVKILHKIPDCIIKEEVPVGQFKVLMGEFTSPTMRGSLNLATLEIIRLWLPKFLNQDMKEYAGVVVEALARIQPAQKKRSYIRQENAELVLLDRWLGDKLSKQAQRIGEFCGYETIQYLMDQLRGALEYRIKEQYRTFKVGEKEYYRATLNRVEKEGIEEGAIEYQEGRFSGLVQKYTDDDLSSVNLDNDYALYRNDPTGEKWTFKMEDIHDLKSFQEGFTAICVEGELKDLKLDKADDFEMMAGYLYEAFFTDHSYIWYPSLDSFKGCLGSGAHDILSSLLTKVLLAKCEADQAAGEKLIRILTEGQKYKFSIFGRMVLYAMDRLWVKYDVLFNEEFLSAYPDFLEGSDYEVELSHLFRNHAIDIDDGVARELKRRIEDLPQWSKNKSKEKEDEKRLLYWQYEWVTMLKDNKRFVSWHEDLKKEFPRDPEPAPQPRGGGLARSIAHQSPLTKEQILQQSVADTVKILVEFKGPKKTWKIMEGKADKEGLADAFRLAVKEDPEKFIKKITLFDDVSLRYTIALVKGFQEAWQADQTFDWKAILSFCQRYIEAHKDDKEEKSDDFDYPQTCRDFAEKAARLITIGSKDERRAFDTDEMIEQANGMFETVFSAFAPFERRERKDRGAINYAINTPIGRVIQYFFLFSLHVKRVSLQHRIVQNWGENKYNRFFEEIDEDIDKGIYEGYIFFGRYLPNMCFLDRDWAHKKMKEINGFDVTDQRWKNFMEGYLSGSAVYKDLYALLRTSYERAIKHKVFEDEIDQNLARHITLGYLRDYEVLNEGFNGTNISDEKGLFELLLQDASMDEKRGRWNEVVDFMWSCTDKREPNEELKKVPPEVIEKILAFWSWTYDKRNFVRKQLGAEGYGLFLSRICLLILILPHVSDNKGKYKTKSWLMECAPYIEKEYHSGFFIEYLLRFTGDDDLKNIAEIYKEMLKTATPIYKEGDIEDLMRRIKNVAENDFQEIVETYGRRGQHFLRDVWEEWKKKEGKKEAK